MGDQIQQKLRYTNRIPVFLSSDSLAKNETVCLEGDEEEL